MGHICYCMTSSHIYGAPGCKGEKVPVHIGVDWNKQNDKYNYTMWLPHERIDIQHELDRLTAERDEAREWARIMRDERDNERKRRQGMENLADYYRAEIGRLHSKHELATCEHQYHDYVKRGFIFEDSARCPDCGELL